ncbi:MAG: ABC transporter permease [Microthrixaceae bacterium]
MSSVGATARFGLRSARRRSGGIAATVAAVGAATALAVAAFGLAAQLDRLVGSTAPASAGQDLLPDGTAVVTAGTPGSTEPTAISDELVQRAAAVDGVLDAAGGYEQPIGVRIPRGSQDERPPMLRGLLFSSEWDPARWTVLRGNAPSGPTVLGDDGPLLAVAMDLGGLATAQADVGDIVRLQTPTGGVRAVVVAEVATVPVPAADGSAGAGSGEATPTVADAHVVVDRESLAALLGAQGRVDRITVTPVPGITVDELTTRLAQALPEDLVIRSAADPEVAEARAVSAVSNGIVVVTWAVAFVAALVAALLVANTLSIVAARRSLEVALARCIGMSRRQVIGSFLTEGAVIGVAAAAIGLVLGTPLSVLGARILHPGTRPDAMLTTPMVATAIVVGFGVTLLAAIVPAWRVSRVAPISALDTGRARRGGRSALLLVVLPVLAAVRRAASGPVLRMAAGEPGRDTRRASAVVATLFVSLLLVGTVLTVSTSTQTSIREQYTSRSDADLFLRRRGVVRVDARSLEARLGAEGRAGYVDLSRVEGSLRGPEGIEPIVRSADLSELAGLFDLDLVDGADPDGTALLSTATADLLGVGVGDVVTLRSTSGVDTELRVRGIHRNSAAVGPAVVEHAVARDAGAEGSFELAAIALQNGASVDDARRWIDRNIGGFNRLGVDTPEGFAQTDTDIAETVTRLLLVLLGGTLALGAVGAANNVALSVADRRRELSMLRAIGATRRQVRRLVTVEAAMLCGLVGTSAAALGAALGVVLLRMAPDELATSARVPWGGLAAVVVVAVALGALAAAVPAHLAARRPPLEGLADD